MSYCNKAYTVKLKNSLYFLLFFAALSCQNTPKSSQKDSRTMDSTNNDQNSEYPANGSFASDISFLKKHDPDLVLLKSKDNPNAQVAVSAKYQSKVFTSTASGPNGQSFGWVNYKAFDGPVDPHMNGFGGENRIWLGPEGGPFSLFFKKGAKMVYDNWATPAVFDTEPWTREENQKGEGTDAVTMTKKMDLTNYNGTALSIAVQRTIRLLSLSEIQKNTGLTVDPQNKSLQVVAYQSVNQLTNTGNTSWTEKTGMPCLWILDMFRPTPSTIIIVPFKTTPVENFKEVATTDYFGPIAEDRLKHNDHALFLKADGKSRGKLGVVPQKAKEWLGSFDVESKVLTLLNYDVEPAAKYLNQQWDPSKQPFEAGDAVNAYNDGPLEDGSQMGPFYELESVSPAAFLAPGEHMVHHQSVYHFTGSEKSLDQLTQKLLGKGSSC